MAGIGAHAVFDMVSQVACYQYFLHVVWGVALRGSMLYLFWVWVVTRASCVWSWRDFVVSS